MVYILDVLLVILVVALGVVGCVLVSGSALKARHAGRMLPFQQRRSFRLPSRSTMLSGILLLVAVLHFGKPYMPLLQSLFPQSSSGSCNIRGNISASGERIYHLPSNRYYDATRIDESHGERWFCSEAEALAAGWRPAKV